MTLSNENVRAHRLLDAILAPSKWEAYDANWRELRLIVQARRIQLQSMAKRDALKTLKESYLAGKIELDELVAKSISIEKDRGHIK